MNRFFGMRTNRTFQSDDSWYHLNEIGGMIFAMIGFPLILAGVFGFFVPESLLNQFSWSVAAVNLASLSAAIYFMVRYSARYTSNLGPLSDGHSVGDE
ncbi:SdpI family protein [Roseibacillus persicicus]|nr:SdpI family protein [Roseibacillus persicicus]